MSEKSVEMTLFSGLKKHHKESQKSRGVMSVFLTAHWFIFLLIIHIINTFLDVCAIRETTKWSKQNFPFR